MGNGIDVKFNLKGIEQKVSPTAFRRGKLAVANQALLDMERFVPKDKGNLRSSGAVSKDSIKYSQPYARAQFYGSAYNKHRSFRFSSYTTGGTGKRWDKRASAKYGKKWGKEALKAMGIK